MRGGCSFSSECNHLYTLNYGSTYILYEVYTRPVVHPSYILYDYNRPVVHPFGEVMERSVHPMFDFLLYAGIHCVDAEDMIRRIELNDSVSKVIRTEVIETVKEYQHLSVTGTQTTEGTGRKSLVFQE